MKNNSIFQLEEFVSTSKDGDQPQNFFFSSFENHSIFFSIFIVDNIFFVYLWFLKSLVYLPRQIILVFLNIYKQNYSFLLQNPNGNFCFDKALNLHYFQVNACNHLEIYPLIFLTNELLILVWQKLNMQYNIGLCELVSIWAIWIHQDDFLLDIFFQ